MGPKSLKIVTLCVLRPLNKLAYVKSLIVPYVKVMNLEMKYGN